MRQFSSVVTTIIAILLVTSLLLSGCSSPAPSPTAAPAAQSTSAQAAPTKAAAPATTTSAAAPATTTSAAAPATTAAAAKAIDPSKPAVKIGLVSAWSGPFAAAVPYWEPMVQMAVDEANAAGGVNGAKVEVITRDDQGDASVDAQKANELKAAGCVAIIGSLQEASNEALYKWSKENKIPVIVPTSPGNELRTTEFHKYGFFPTPNSDAWARAAADFVVEKKVKSVYIMGGDTTMCRQLHEGFWKVIKDKFASAGVTDAGFTLRDLTNADWQADISTVIAKKPELLILITGGPPFVSFLQQAQQMNLFSQVKVMGWESLAANNAAPFKKDFPQGVYSIVHTPFYLDTPEMKAFTKAYYERTKVYPDEIGVPDYIGAKALIQAMNEAKSTDADAIIAAMEKITVDSPVGKLTFPDYSHQPEMPIYVVTSTISPDWPQAIGTDIKTYKDGLYMTKDEILAARKGQ